MKRMLRIVVICTCFHPLVICHNLFLLYLAVYCKLKPSWELLLWREPTPNIFLFLFLDTDFWMSSFSSLTSFYEIERLDLKGRPFTPHKYKNIHSPYPPRQKIFKASHRFISTSLSPAGKDLCMQCSLFSIKNEGKA